uniref:Serine/threonine-protein kinase NAK n=1 Tax=Cajanus cajan TaxID=3821 RepID=A0A151S9J8_CAJCA|nr:putative serine/threonine-protein kinase NAK [Cajanus cajan]
MFKLGEGGFGSVYKGSIMLPNAQGHPIPVAIKRLNTRGFQGHKEWLAEVQFLGIVDHPNLVKLLGYCSVDGERGIQRLLVYEFMPNRSLEDHLFNKSLPTLPWKTRLEIMLGAAQGLAYLHEGLEIQHFPIYVNFSCVFDYLVWVIVIYRDFKSSNVLLDQDFHPKLSDFGLAREGPQGDQTHVSTAVVGTHGYAAPEYIETGHLKVQSDMWSFGVVLYEILTGRRTLERNRPTAEQKLLDWVKHYPADSSRFVIIMDPRLRNQYSLPAARKIAKLADSCLKKNPEDRPSMSQIVESLKQALQYSETPNTSRDIAESSSSRSKLVRKSK